MSDSAKTNASPSTVSEEVPARQDQTAQQDLDTALDLLVSTKDEWATLGVPERLAFIEEMLSAFQEVVEPWAKASCAGEGIPLDAPVAGEEWLVGPYLVIRNLQLLRQSLEDIRQHGAPRIPGPVRTRENGQVTAQVFPASSYDRLFYPGVTADIWMKPGVDREEMVRTQASAYREAEPKGKVALVLGAGNVSSIGPTDALYKFFVENQVVLYKMHPLNAYLGPFIETAFRPLVDRGFLQVVYGGAEVGEYLCQHPSVDEIHITGSHRTVEAIAFGTGEEGRKRKAENRPRNTKRLTTELGNVSPLIVVPGPWTSSDMAYQAENIVSSLANNAGFNCNATRVVIQHAGWNQRRELNDAIRSRLRETPTRNAYYPGAEDRFLQFMEAHPEAESFGSRAQGALPWTFIPDVDPRAEDEICFNTEAFCSVFSETALEAESPAEFLDRAVEFANERLWGTLNVTLLVHGASLRDKETRAALDRALENLRYGTVSINHWAAVGFGVMSTTWGAFPGHDLQDIQSGTGVVHNTLMFEQPEKTVLRAAFKAYPKPPWFVSHGNTRALARSLSSFETEPSILKLPAVFWHALRG